MKRIYLMVLSAFLIQFAQAQKNFIWEKKDTISEDFAQLYAETKQFIAETWGTSNNVIQKDDKESGTIIVNSSIVRKLNIQSEEYVYSYKYTLTFKLKDKQFKCNLDHVFCDSAYITKGKTPIEKIEPFEGDKYPETPKAKSPGLPKIKAIQMMNFIRQELQGIVEGYAQSLRKVVVETPIRKKKHQDEE